MGYQIQARLDALAEGIELVLRLTGAGWTWDRIIRPMFETVLVSPLTAAAKWVLRR